MRIVHDLGELERGRPCVLTIGAFDGVHRGHQFLIRQVVERARSLDYDSVVITFDPRPAVVLRPGSLQLSSADEKARVIGASGVDTVVIMSFTRELSQLPAGQFLVNILEHINVSELWVGNDFAFGQNRQGNVDFLVRSGGQSGFDVHVISRKKLGDTPISSSAVRELVTSGYVDRAALLLGHYVRLDGTVETGAGRGDELGFPTANLSLSPTQLLPGEGVYAGYLSVSGQQHAAAISVGTNPQFDGHQLSVEAYALDFSGDIRGAHVALDFVQRLRGQEIFPSVERLKEAIAQDVDQTRTILAEAVEPGELLLK